MARKINVIALHRTSNEPEAYCLELEVRRNRRRTLCLLSCALLLAACWAVRSEYRARQSAKAGPPIRAAASLRPRPAAPDLEQKRVYPYSVIPGGVYTAEALSRALANDSVAAAHYAGFEVAKTRPIAAEPGLKLYASYRVGDAVYWTSKPLSLKPHETLLTDGVHLARARCGNRLSVGPQQPVGPEDELASLEADEPAEEWRDSGATPGSAGALYPEFVRAPEIFPAAFSETPGELSDEATTAAAEFTDDAAKPDNGDETLSGYADSIRGGFGQGFPVGAPIAGSKSPGALPSPVQSLAGAGVPSGFGSSWQPELLPWPAGKSSGLDSPPGVGFDLLVAGMQPPSTTGQSSDLSAVFAGWLPFRPSVLEFPTPAGASGFRDVDGIRGHGIPPGEAVTDGGGGGGRGSSDPLAPSDTPPEQTTETPIPTPEPAPLVLSAVGLALLVAVRRFRR